MAGRTKSAKSKADEAGKAQSAESAKSGRLGEILLARAPAEDLAGYDRAVLDRAAKLSGRAVMRHHKGQSVVSIETDPDIVHKGLPVTVITVVNDNMPFLFDSVLGEITESAGMPDLVAHPVLVVRHGRGGVEEILADGGSARDHGADRLSVIHVHVKPLAADDAEALKSRLEKLLGQVRAATAGWKPMLARLDRAVSEFRYAPVPLDKDAVTEAIAFLEWLRDDNFTFLGMRELHYSGGEKTGALERSDRPGLGILADPDVLILRRDTSTDGNTTPEIRAFLHGPDPLIVTKANARSSVHRRAYLDYIGVKTYTTKGALAGELRIVGLFTSTAYTRSVMKIPYLRSKAQAVLKKSGFDPGDHSGKALINVLESYPRDELFQIPVPILRKHADAILGLVERPRVRALVRVDQFDRFVSVLIFVPRDRYDSIVREQIGQYLKTVFDGRLSAYYPAFPEGGLARVHFIIGRSGGKTPKVDPAAIERAIRDIIRTWEDALRDEAVASGVDASLASLAARFSTSYQGSFSSAEALRDAARVSSLSTANRLALDYYRHADQKPEQAALKIYHYGEPVALSRRVPILENIGFRVISERTFEVIATDGAHVFIHDMELQNAHGRPIDLADSGALFEDVLFSVWRGQADNDAYNALAQTAGLRSTEIVILRAYGRYLQQAGIPQSQDFIAAALNRYPEIARNLFALFTLLHDPVKKDGATRAKALTARIAEALQDVPNLDDDTIIRRYLNLIESTLRTNHFVADKADTGQSLAMKLDSRRVEGLPDPRPWREIFVYGSEVEGVHLRFGPVARGGLRWSDRAQDYRTEVLGLVKAQQVKNAVIVPVGAKGGFFPKRVVTEGGRDAVFQAGKAAYINFVSSLLSITDNIEGDVVVHPKDVVRHDADDPYFVVAADKGTATFSDTANSISEAHGFWLDDAFASGGSAGYDHKKMGITAKGAWEAVKRHFREMNRDIQAEPFTVVGVGDMSGDVFGNGMLLSDHTQLIAAFDHRDIFIDPDPHPVASMAERKRMFDLPRSSWQDYDQSKLSAGGMIVSRAQKSVTLTAQAASAIGLSKTTASPSEIMNAILKAPVDLLWFGGIGTYVRATSETNQDASDRANDAIRVTAAEVRAKVIGEGANLGVTQRARIEFGLLGGACNSDAIDNSGGVNSSDVEVNIKIALASAMRGGGLTRPARNKLLAEMTPEVGTLVLTNNYHQPLAISLQQKRGLADLPHQARFMSALEARGLLDRIVETLPSDAALIERQARGEPLTRAELGVLLAYAKIVLFSDLVASNAPDDPYFERDLIAYFPDRMVKSYSVEIGSHRLRREIIARSLANDLVNRGGPSFVNRLQDQTGHGPGDVTKAFVVVREGFGLPALYSEIDALDSKIDGKFQLDLYQSLARLTYIATAWLLKNDTADLPIATRVADLQEARKVLEPKLPTLLPSYAKARIDERRRELVASGTPEKLATRLMTTETAQSIPDIAMIARSANAGLIEAAKAFYGVTETFRIGRIEDAARTIAPADYYDGLAIGRAIDTIAAARRGMTIAVMASSCKDGDPLVRWLEAGGERITRIRERLQSLTEGGEISVSRLSVAAGLMNDLTAQ